MELMPRVEVKSIADGEIAGSTMLVETRVQRSPPSVDRYRPVPAPEFCGVFVSPVPTKIVLPVASLGSTVSAPMLLVPRPWPIQRHFGSSGCIASSVRQTPPPAAPAHRRHGPFTWHVGEIASAAIRPEKLPVPLAPPAVVLIGPRLAHAAPADCCPRYATPRNTQYLPDEARATMSEFGSPGYAWT